jgi:nitrogen PTS system EIIA component
LQDELVMPRTLLTIQEVAESLHVSTREVVRMAEQHVLPAVRVRGQWQFRAGEVWNWIDANLERLPARRKKDRDPAVAGGLLVSTALDETVVDVNLAAKTKSSVLRELVRLAERGDPTIDCPALIEGLAEREAQGSTALQYGVAVPHPARPFYSDGPVLAAARTVDAIAFGERGGGLTDLFFLVCCPNQKDHLLYLGRLCRLLIEAPLRESLRAASSASEFVEAIRSAEAAICQNE